MITTELREGAIGFTQSPTLLHGEYGTGKTLLAAQYPKPYFLMCESNEEYRHKLHYDNATSWDVACEHILSFLSDKHNFKTFVVDNIANFYDLASTKLIIEHNKKLKKDEEPVATLSDFPFVKGYEAVDAMIKTALNPLLMTPNFNLILIAHSAEHEVKMLNGDTYFKIIPSLPNKRARKYFLDLTPNIFYYFFSKQQRYIRITQNDFIMAKNRGGDNFKTVDGKVIVNVPAGKSPEEAFKYLTAAYNNKLKNDYAGVV